MFSPDGAPVVKLPPGHLVVPGTTETPGSPAARAIDDPKRLRRYADKQLRPTEDKATPPRQPDPRLRNPLAGSG